MTKVDKSAIVKEELLSRMEEFKEALGNEQKKLELENSILGSEVLIRFEVFFPSGKKGKFSDGLFLYMNDSGEIVDAEFYIRDADDVTIAGLETEDFNVVKELFKDSFSLEIE
jgi:hypothetical protein